MLRITDAAARSCAMNYGCWYTIVRSEKTHTLARNEFQVLMCHHAVRKDTRWPATNSAACCELRMRQRDRMQWLTAADTPSCGQKRHTRWPATNSSACTELRLLIRHRAVRKDTHAGLQRIPTAGSPSWYQQRHTRWHATNSGWWRDHTDWHETNSGWWCDFVRSETCQRMLGLKDFRVKQT